MKFDTLNKKPTVFNILYLTLITAAVLAILWFLKVDDIILYSLISIFYLGAVIAMLVRAFFRQLRYNPYSYNTIIYFGFSLFLLVNLIAEILITSRIIKNPEMYDITVHLDWIRLSGLLYVIFSFPFVLIFGILLFISNIALIRHEGRSLKNILGILLSIFMIVSIAELFKNNLWFSGSYEEMVRHELIMTLFSSIILYLESMLAGAIAASVIAARIEPDSDRDFMIILGCGMKKDGTPTPLLKGRIDRAVAFYKKQKEATGKELIFVCSGGQGSDEPIPESTCMKNCLTAQGIDEKLIIEENKSTSTYENMKFSKEKILARNPEGKIAFSTTNYHVFRSGVWARRVKMRALGVGAKTKWYFWPNAWVREFLGLMSEHRGKQLLVLGGMVLFYILATFLILVNFY